MKSFIKQNNLSIALLAIILQIAVFGGPSYLYANNNFYRQQQMMRQQQMQMQQQREMQRRQAEMQRRQAEMQRRQAEMQRQRQRAMQQRQEAMRQQRARQQQIQQQRRAQQERQRIARQQKLQKFQNQKNFQKQNQKQLALKQKELQKRSQIRNQQKIKARNDRLAALQKKRGARQSKEKEEIQKRQSATLLSLRKHLKSTSALTSYKPAQAKSNTNLAAFKKIQVSNQAKERTTKQLEIQRKTVKQQLQKIAQTREHLGRKTKTGDGEQKQRRTDIQKRSQKLLCASKKIEKFICFTVGTKVHTPSGLKNIEKLKTGDEVYVFSDEDRKVIIRTIEGTSHSYAEELIELTIGTDTLKSTASHPYWDNRNQRWLEAKEVAVGSEVLLHNGNVGIVSAKKKVYRNDEYFDVYNLIIRHDHNYFVGSQGVLVHNGSAETFSDYHQARNAALSWLEKQGQGFKAEKVVLGKFGPNKGNAIGMQTSDGKIGFRIEFDKKNGAHINVWSGKEKGPHFKFEGSEKTVNRIVKRFAMCR